MAQFFLTENSLKSLLANYPTEAQHLWTTDSGTKCMAHKLSKAFQYNYLEHKTHGSEIQLKIQAKLSG